VAERLTRREIVALSALIRADGKASVKELARLGYLPDSSFGATYKTLWHWSLVETDFGPYPTEWKISPAGRERHAFEAERGRS
jgi:hypothetical protein